MTASAIKTCEHDLQQEGNMTQQIIDLIDEALAIYPDRQFITQREHTDVLLDLRLAVAAHRNEETDKELWDSLTKITSAN